MKTLKKITSLGALVLALSGCTEVGRQRSIQKDIAEANRVFDNGVTKDLTVHLATEATSVGPEIHFVDIDGDGKTVEEYIVRYNQGAGITNPFGYKKHLIRKGAIRLYDRDGIVSQPRRMTAQEEAQIDSTYQALLKIYQR